MVRSRLMGPFVKPTAFFFSFFAHREASLLERYPLPAIEAEDAANGFVPKRDQAAFRDYKEASDRVREFYRMNHEKQTLDFVLSKKAQYGKLDRVRPLRSRRLIGGSLSQTLRRWR